MIHTTGNLKFNNTDMLAYSNPKIEVQSIYSNRESNWEITMMISVYSSDKAEVVTKSIIVPIETLSSTGASSSELVTNLNSFLEQYLIQTLSTFNTVVFEQT
jgi:hypothetical protein